MTASRGWPTRSAALAAGAATVLLAATAALAGLAGLTQQRAPSDAKLVAPPAPPPLALDAATAAALSGDARRLLDAVLASGDHQRRPFIVIDKRQARLWAFDGGARLLGSTPVLLGAAVGDHTVPGIGLRPIDLVRPEERTTPAGRFAAEPGRNALGEDILWVDYEAAVSLHRVRATDPAQHRLQRLASPTIDDNRVSWGCINVPADFYDAVIDPTFAKVGRGQRGVIYLLPEVRPMHMAFAFAPRPAGGAP